LRTAGIHGESGAPADNATTLQKGPLPAVLHAEVSQRRVNTTKKSPLYKSQCHGPQKLVLTAVARLSRAKSHHPRHQ
jgi:hypothetical protein